MRIVENMPAINRKVAGCRFPVTGIKISLPTAGRVIDIQGPATGNWKLVTVK